MWTLRSLLLCFRGGRCSEQSFPLHQRHVSQGAGWGVFYWTCYLWVRFLGMHLPALSPWKTPLVTVSVAGQTSADIWGCIAGHVPLCSVQAGTVLQWLRAVVPTMGSFVLNWGLLLVATLHLPFTDFPHKTPLNCVYILSVWALPCTSFYLVTFPVLLLPENSVSAWQHLMLFLSTICHLVSWGSLLPWPVHHPRMPCFLLLPAGTHDLRLKMDWRGCGLTSACHPVLQFTALAPPSRGPFCI